MGVDKFIQNQADWGVGGGVGERVGKSSPHCGQIILKNQADFNRKHRLYHRHFMSICTPPYGHTIPISKPTGLGF